MFLKTQPKTETQALREEVTSLRRQLLEQKELTAEYRRLHQSASIRKQELFGAIRKLHGFIEEVMQ